MSSQKVHAKSRDDKELEHDNLPRVASITARHALYTRTLSTLFGFLDD